MTRHEVFAYLMRRKKEELADELTLIHMLLTHDTGGEGAYDAGWRDSRITLLSITEILKHLPD